MFGYLVLDYCFFNSVISLKLLSNAQNGFQYDFWHVWNFSDVDKQFGPWSPYLLQKYLKQYKTNAKSFSNISFLQIYESHIFMFWKLCVPIALRLRNCIFCFLEMLELWNFEFSFLNFQYYAFWNFENINFWFFGYIIVII